MSTVFPASLSAYFDTGSVRSENLHLALPFTRSIHDIRLRIHRDSCDGTLAFDPMYPRIRARQVPHLVRRIFGLKPRGIDEFANHLR